MSIEPIDPILRTHIREPRQRGPLPEDGGHGICHDAVLGRVEVGLLVREGSIVETAFVAEGDPVITGCSSFLLGCATGQTVGWARCVRPPALRAALRLPFDDVRAEMVVRAFLSALEEADARSIESEPRQQPRRGTPSGHRATRQVPASTRKDRLLLYPGETHEELIRERNQILGILENLETCLNIATISTPFRHDETSRLREDLVCLTLTVQTALPLLKDKEVRLVRMLGTDGLLPSEIAKVLRVSHQAVRKQMWALAGRIQEIFRQRG
jgi:hypothetical protein